MSTEACTATTKAGTRCKNTANLIDGVCPSHHENGRLLSEIEQHRRVLRDLQNSIDLNRRGLERIDQDIAAARKRAAMPPPVAPGELLGRAVKAAEAGDFGAAQTWCALSAELRQVERATQKQERPSAMARGPKYRGPFEDDDGEVA